MKLFPLLQSSPRRPRFAIIKSDDEPIADSLPEHLRTTT